MEGRSCALLISWAAVTNGHRLVADSRELQSCGSGAQVRDEGSWGWPLASYSHDAGLGGCPWPGSRGHIPPLGLHGLCLWVQISLPFQGHPSLCVSPVRWGSHQPRTSTKGLVHVRLHVQVPGAGTSTCLLRGHDSTPNSWREMEMEGGLERGWGEGGGRGGPAWLRRASWSHVSLGHPCVAARCPERETMVSTQAAVRGPGRVTLAWSGEGGVLGAGPGGWGRGLGRPGALARGRGGRCEGLKGSWGYGSGAGRKQVEAAGTGGKGTRSWADRPHCPRDPRGAASALERPRERMAPCPAFAGLCWSRRGTRPGRRARDREGSWLRAPKAGSPGQGLSSL